PCSPYPRRLCGNSPGCGGGDQTGARNARAAQDGDRLMLLAAMALAAALPDIVVQTDAGRIAGGALPDGRHLFRGIPFAQPPVGALRWKPPLPAKPWAGIRDATRSGPGCMQIDYRWNHDNAAN